MNLSIERRNLFDLDESWYLAHCISADFVMGAGIAKEFVRRFPDLAVLREGWVYGEVGDCIPWGRIFNLITKQKYWQKPNYMTLYCSLLSMRDYIIAFGVKKLGMPKIGCGLDRLRWSKVEAAIKQAFGDLDIDILVCYLEED